MWDAKMAALKVDQKVAMKDATMVVEWDAKKVDLTVYSKAVSMVLSWVALSVDQLVVPWA